MHETTNTPTFPEGSTVRDRETGKTYRVGGTSTAAGWTVVVLPEPDENGDRVALLPTDELELVEVLPQNGENPEGGDLLANSGENPVKHFTAAVKFADGYDTIQARISADGDYELGYRFDYEGHAENVEGAQPFLIDKRHLDDFIALLQRVKDSL
ncbi:hypothetical protein ACFFIO_09525 [Citricoccus parietis]|uniref:Uncharacterized protein n=1 Tax=Citricoccus parietis TaxID=592307 RepID=A0ABV6F5E9_9MICC